MALLTPAEAAGRWERAVYMNDRIVGFHLWLFQIRNGR